MSGVLSLAVVSSFFIFSAISAGLAAETDYSTGRHLSAIEDAPDPGVSETQSRRQQRKAVLRAARAERRNHARQNRMGKQQETENQALTQPSSVSDIKVAFKVDPRLTRGLHMGDRWVSTSTYVGTTGQETVEAKARGVNATGMVVQVRPIWIAEDPEMVGVTPTQGDAVQIKVKRAGQSSLQVTSAGFAKKLLIKATPKDSVLRVEITQ